MEIKRKGAIAGSLILLTIFIIGIGIYTQYYGVDAQFEKAVSLGNEQLAGADYKGAEKSFQDALELRDGNSEAFVGLGEACIGLEELERAEDLFNRAIQTENAPAIAYRKLAQIYQGQGDEQKAVEILKSGFSVTKDQELGAAAEKLRQAMQEFKVEHLGIYKYTGTDGYTLSIDLPKITGSKVAKSLNKEILNHYANCLTAIEEAKAGIFKVMDKFNLVYWIVSYEAHEKNGIVAIALMSRTAMADAGIGTVYDIYYYDCHTDRVLSPTEYAKAFKFTPEEVLMEYNRNEETISLENQVTTFKEVSFYVDENGMLVFCQNYF